MLHDLQYSERENETMKKKSWITGIVTLAFLMVLSCCMTQPDVTSAKSTSFKIEKKVSSLTAGKTFQIQTNASSNVKYASTAAKIASVSKDGQITAKRCGTTTIRVRHGKEVLTFQLTVKPKKVVGIDPGHQISANSGTEPNGPGSSVYKMKVSGGTCGVITRKPEYQLTLEIGLALEKELWNRGYQVVMTRESNEVDISNKQRALLLNKANADIAVRIHADGSTSGATGATMLCPSPSNPYVSNLSKESKKLSDAIIEKYIAATDIKNRGVVYRDDLTGTNWSTIPVTLIELGFMTNGQEDTYMSSKSGQKAMVLGIADGIDSYFGY